MADGDNRSRTGSSASRTRGALTPGALNGKKPKDYGTGRRCACGTKIMRYSKGFKCGLCESSDERHAAAVEANPNWNTEQEINTMEPETMNKDEVMRELGISKSEVEKHEIRGTLVRVGKIGRGRKAKYDANVVRALKASGRFDKSEGVTNLTGVGTPREEGCNAEGEDCCGQPGNCQIPDPDQGAADDPSEGTCCGAADACSDCPEDPERIAESMETRAIKTHVRAVERHAISTALVNKSLEVHSYALETAAKSGSLLLQTESILRELGLEKAIIPSIKQQESDPEIQAMGLVGDALAKLDRAQRVRIVLWVTNRFGLNSREEEKPAPFADTTSPRVL